MHTLRDDIVTALTVAGNTAFASKTSGVYRSDDAGRTWWPVIGGPLAPAPIGLLAVTVSPRFAADGRVWVGASDGLLTSSDRGATWSALPLRDPAPTVLTLIAAPNGVLFAGTQADGVFRSSDSGGRWSAWNFGLLDLSVLALAASPNFEQDDLVFAGTVSGLYRSTTGGRAWRLAADLPDEAPALCVAAAVDGQRVAAGLEESGLWCSRDGGVAWVAVAQPELAGTVNAVAFAADGACWAANNDSLWRSDDGATWTEIAHFGDAVPTALAAHGPRAVLVGLSDSRVLTIMPEAA
jgi:ligand-binding sensor domain-containing protein